MKILRRSYPAAMTVSALYKDAKNNPTSLKVGNTKFLFIECVAALISGDTKPGSCARSSRADDMVKEILD